MSLPRLVVAAPSTGQGKTTVATGLMAALRSSGRTVSGHKVGPDYIDPGYHGLATGRPGRNLDPHLVGESLVGPLLLHGARGADVAVIEGVMGLYDGRLGTDGFASTAHVAALTRTPVLLVLDVARMSRSAAAIAAGMVAFDPSVRIGGVVLNRARPGRNTDEIRGALERVGLPVLGVLPPDEALAAPSRHLGLVPAAERDASAAMVARLGEQVGEHVDLDAVLELARSVPALDVPRWEAAAALGTAAATVDEGARRPVVAVAGGRAFTFRYPETDELLEAAGCQVVAFDPLADRSLPPGTQGIYLGGGFPEMYAAELAANGDLLADLREAVSAGVPTVAECAGLLYLAQSLDGVPMAGVVPATAAMSERLTLRYPVATAVSDSLLTRAGEQVTGHEFHRTTTTPAGSGYAPAWEIDGATTGYAGATLHASYLHVHWAGHPRLAARFAEAAGAHAGRAAGATPAGRAAGAASAHAGRAAGAGASVGRAAGAAGRRRVETNTVVSGGTADRVGLDTDSLVPRESGSTSGGGSTSMADPLRHHGDSEARGLLDLAVNVYPGPRPEWLDRALHDAIEAAGTYPDAEPATRDLAQHLGRTAEEVLLTAGAAEVFTLVARLRRWRRPVVVHPQFTEPHAALQQAGHQVTTVLCRSGDGFALDPAAVPDDADLVMIGNPTNPTGVLHPAASIERLLRPGRTVVVDEAFMDAVPEESQSLVRERRDGLLVVRSLTKHWSVPGIRAGYVVGDRALVEPLTALQTPWSVSVPALAAVAACSGEQAAAEARQRALTLARWREVVEDGLRARGIEHVPSAASFVLARVGAGVHQALRERGIAVRRADTFPGLDGEWVRIAVRPPEVTDRLLTALDEVRAPARTAAC